jgi:hypothetical protein
MTILTFKKKQGHIVLDQIRTIDKSRLIKRLGSIGKVLRPVGFHKDNPPHLCEKLTCEAILFNVRFITDFINKKQNQKNL